MSPSLVVKVVEGHIGVSVGVKGSGCGGFILSGQGEPGSGLLRPERKPGIDTETTWNV